MVELGVLVLEFGEFLLVFEVGGALLVGVLLDEVCDVVFELGVLVLELGEFDCEVGVGGVGAAADVAEFAFVD